MLEDLRVLVVPCAATIQATQNFAVHTKFFDQAFNSRLPAPLESGAASPLEWLFTRTRCPFSRMHTKCFMRFGYPSHVGTQNSSMEFKKRGSDTTITGQINSMVNTERREHRSIFLIIKNGCGYITYRWRRTVYGQLQLRADTVTDS